MNIKQMLLAERDRLLDEACRVEEALTKLYPDATLTHRKTGKAVKKTRKPSKKRQYAHPRIARKNISAGIKGYWASMTREERSTEVKKRRAVAKLRKQGR